MPLCWAALSSPLQPKASADHILNHQLAASYIRNPELSVIMQEGKGSGLSHEGIVLHDAPVLGCHSPQLSTTAQGKC